MSHTDFDSFLAERRAAAGPAATLTLCGRDYDLPRDTPLAYALMAEANAEEEGREALEAVLEPIFGATALADWAAGGLGVTELEIVLAWAIANMRKPGSMDLAEAARLVEEAETGKARRLATPSASKTPVTSGAPS